MNELKTKQNENDVMEFLNQFVDSEQKKEDSLSLIKLMENITSCPPKMWGTSIIGFDNYHYQSERSRQQGDWFIIGFSPRKAAISLYVYTGLPEHEHLLVSLGKFKKGKACLYINKLSDIDIDALKKIMIERISYYKKRYPHQ